MISLPSPAARRSVLRAAVALAAIGAMPARADEAPKILVIGDSQAQGLAGGLLRMFRRDRAYRVLDHSKISTGLLARSSYDWPANVRTLVSTENAAIGVAMFGANDRPSLSAKARADEAQVAAFKQSYGAHVADIARTLKSACPVVVWVGHPIVKDVAYQDDMKLLNDVYREQSTQAGAVFLSTWERFMGPDGQYSASGPGEDGVTTRLRADDGVHLTPAGYDIVARMVMDKAKAQPS